MTGKTIVRRWWLWTARTSSVERAFLRLIPSAEPFSHPKGKNYEAPRRREKPMSWTDKQGEKSMLASGVVDRKMQALRSKEMVF